MALSKNWLFEEPQDNEYKKYKLLAYFQTVQKDFKDNKLYPHLDDLFTHYRDTIIFKQNLESINEGSKKFKGIENGIIIYEYYIPEPGILDMIELMEFSMELFNKQMNEAYELQEKLLESVKVEHLGILPLNMEEGYLIFEISDGLMVYEYERTSVFYEASGMFTEDYLPTSYIIKFKGSELYKCGIEKVKGILNKKKSVPAVFYARTDFVSGLPMEESFLPLAKKRLENIIGSSV